MNITARVNQKIVEGKNLPLVFFNLQKSIHGIGEDVDNIKFRSIFDYPIKSLQPYYSIVDLSPTTDKQTNNKSLRLKRLGCVNNYQSGDSAVRLTTHKIVHYLHHYDAMLLKLLLQIQNFTHRVGIQKYSKFC